jgi:hypothetical protein
MSPQHENQTLQKDSKLYTKSVHKVFFTIKGTLPDFISLVEKELINLKGTKPCEL